MATVTHRRSRVAGITCTVPSREITTSDAAAQFGGVDSKRVIAMTGIERRRIVPPGICTSDLCVDAANRLLDELSWPRESIGALIFVTQTPDYILPATACLLQQRLSLPTSCACIDVNLGCSGYVYGLWLASSLIESGISRVLLLVGDTLSKYLSEQDRSVAFLFGDCGTATALEKGDSELTFVLGTDGSGAMNLIIPAGQSRQRPSPQSCIRSEGDDGGRRGPHELYMNGAEVMAFTLKEVPGLFEQLLVESQLTREDLAAVVMHQANQFLLEQLTRKMGLNREMVPLSLKDFGNTSTATIPLTLSTSLGPRIEKQTLNLALMGFGVGWSWAGCIGEFGPMCTPQIASMD